MLIHSRDDFFCTITLIISILILILMFKPAGLLGKAQVEKV